ncbi:MAG: aromatic amino acid transport family protein [Patescibacteria group bacterium]|nr:aromatic amino acid transport family protein [Patescibacteria group bacterium]
MVGFFQKNTLYFLKALSVFLGTIIGVGIFSLPFVASKAGFFITVFYFIIITIVTIILHFIYGKICAETETIHRLPGYVEKYLGKKYKKIAIFTTGFVLTGGLLSYLIVGGEFLKFLFGSYFGEDVLIYVLIFFAVGAYLIFKGIKSISKIGLAFFAVFLIILFLFFLKAVPHINFANFQTMDLKFLVLPYGVILFSLWGFAIVPELKEMMINNYPDRNLDMKTKKKNLRKVQAYGIFLASVIYLFFIFIIFGVCGINTSKEALSGFNQILGNGVIKLGFLFGIITCFTSFIALGLTLKKTLCYDFKISKNISWFIACFFPLFLYLLGLKEFITIIGITGAVAIGIEYIIIIFLYKAFLRQKFSQKINPLFYILSLFFILGVVLEIFYFIK